MAESLAVEDFHQFGGKHCQTATLKNIEDKVYVSDHAEKLVGVTIEDLQKARSSKFPPFPPKNKLLKIKYPSKVGNLEKGIREAIKECYSNMLNPPMKNIGLAGKRLVKNVE